MSEHRDMDDQTTLYGRCIISPSELVAVDPMMVRRFLLVSGQYYGGGMLIDRFTVEDVGIADARLDFDAEHVDCSNRIFDLTTQMMMSEKRPLEMAFFPSRRWREGRIGGDIHQIPNRLETLLYIGNPVILTADRETGVHVGYGPEFLIKNGCELGY